MPDWLAFNEHEPTETKVTVPALMVHTPGVALVIVTERPLDALAETVKVPDVIVRALSEPKLIVFVPVETVNVKVAEVDAKFESVGVKVPVITAEPGFRMLNTAPETNWATVESLEE